MLITDKTGGHNTEDEHVLTCEQNTYYKCPRRNVQ